MIVIGSSTKHGRVYSHALPRESPVVIGRNSARNMRFDRFPPRTDR